MRTAHALLTTILTACTAQSAATLSDGPVGQPSDAPVNARADAGPGTSSLGLYASGGRLKMRVLVSADGAKAFFGWHDAQRNEDCQFIATGDGRQRCLPLDLSVFGGYFSDAECLRRVALDNRPCPTSPPQYGVVIERSTTCPATTFYAPWSVGTEYSGDIYQLDGHGVCLKMASAPPGTFWTLTAEVPPSSFQLATEQIVD